jgi:hypothetical protein
MKLSILCLFSLGLFSLPAGSQVLTDTASGVRLSTFHASTNNNAVQLNWTVACRISFARFEVQRSADGINFNTISSFQADYLRCLQPFDYTDASAIGQVYYRIKVGDIDGRYSTEKVIRITGKKITETEIKVVSPVNGSFLQLTVLATGTEQIGVQLLTGTGSILQSFNMHPAKGVNRIEVPFTVSRAGVYFLSFQAEGKRQAVRFVKSN